MSLQFEMTLDGGIASAGGTFYHEMAVLVDGNKRIPESDESNNLAVVTIGNLDVDTSILDIFAHGTRWEDFIVDYFGDQVQEPVLDRILLSDFIAVRTYEDLVLGDNGPIDPEEEEVQLELERPVRIFQSDGVRPKVRVWYLCDDCYQDFFLADDYSALFQNRL